MKKVLLIGDSIREGYDKYVKKAFEGIAEVYYPNDNCRFSAYVLRHLVDWKNKIGSDNDIDVLHWNAGLWDCLTLWDGECLTPIEIYKYYIERICKEIRRLFPNSKVIFATSTPVIERLFLEGVIRYNKDIQQYNNVAIKVIKKYGFVVNDLNSLLNNCPEEYHSDCTHYYTKEATKLISQRVISYIEQELDIKSNSIDYNIEFQKDERFIGI